MKNQPVKKAAPKKAAPKKTVAKPAAKKAPTKKVGAVTVAPTVVLPPVVSTTRHNVVIGVLVVIVLALFLGLVKKEKELDDIKARQDFQTTQVEQYKNKLGQVISEQEVTKTESEATIKSMAAEIFKLKKDKEKRIKQVNSLYRIIQNSGVTGVYIPYKDDEDVKPDTFYQGDLVHKDSVVIPPKKFDVSTEHYSIAGTVELKGVTIDSISMPDTVSLRTAEQRPKGIFNRIVKSNSVVVQSVHSNPYYTTSGMQSLILQPKPSSWNRWIKPTLFAVGAAVLTKELSK